MPDQGTLATAAVGGYELAAGSKPTLYCLHLEGEYTASDNFLISAEGLLTGTANGGSVSDGTPSASNQTVVYGAGSVSMGTVASGVLPITVVLGAGDGKDDLDIFGCYGSVALGDGGSTINTPGMLSVKSIAGGTVNLIASFFDVDDGSAIAPASGTDYVKLCVYANAKSFFA